jgi:outer membrane protein TolC
VKIKGKKLLMCMAAIFVFGGAKAQGENAPLATMDVTLQKAIEIALAENPTIKVAEKEIELKKIADEEAWQNLLPDASVNLSLQHTILAAELSLGGQKFKMGKDGTNTAAGTATLNLPLFAPAVYQVMKLTKEDVKLAEEKARSSKLDLVNQVKKAYYQALLAQDSYNVIEQSYKISKENFDVVNAKYGQGRVSEYDKISAEVQMRGLNSSLVSAKSGLSNAKLQLKVLMGVTANVDIAINDKLSNYENDLALAELETAENELANNSALRQLDMSESMLERNLKMQKTNFMPTVAFQLTGQYQSLYNDTWNLFDYAWSPSASMAFVVNIPLFKASNFTKLKTTKLQIAQLQDTRVNTQRQLNMAVKVYKDNMTSSMAQVNSNREAVNQADKAVTIATKRYEVGRGTILELNQSEVSLTQAQLTYNQSIYEYLTNKADFEYTLGRENF